METEIKRRRPPKQGKKKIVKSISFSGEEGYKALEVLENNNHTLGMSGLVIDLLLIFEGHKERLDLHSDDVVIEMLKKNIGLIR